MKRTGWLSLLGGGAIVAIASLMPLAWAEAPAWAGASPVADYLEALTEVDPGDVSIILPPLVTVVARRPAGLPG